MANLQAELKKLEEFFKPENLAKLNIKCDEIALVLVDVQKEFADPKGARGNDTTEKVAERIAALTPIFRNAGVQVYAVYNRKSIVETAPWGMAQPVASDIVIDPKFHHYTPHPSDEVIGKTSDDAFETSLIDYRLKVGGKKMVLVAGFNASGCEKLTALSAAKKGYSTCFLTDLSANDDYAAMENIFTPYQPVKEMRDLHRAGILTAPSLNVLAVMAEIHENGQSITAKNLSNTLAYQNCNEAPLPENLTVAPTQRAKQFQHDNYLGR